MLGVVCFWLSDLPVDALTLAPWPCGIAKVQVGIVCMAALHACVTAEPVLSFEHSGGLAPFAPDSVVHWVEACHLNGCFWT